MIDAQPPDDILRVSERAVREDKFPPRQRIYGMAERRIGEHRRNVDVMDEMEKLRRLEPIDRHQARKRRAMLDIKVLLDTSRFRGVDVEIARDEGGHALVDLREEIAFRRIERVVEIENPGFDRRKIVGGRRWPAAM